MSVAYKHCMHGGLWYTMRYDYQCVCYIRLQTAVNEDIWAYYSLRAVFSCKINNNLLLIINDICGIYDAMYTCKVVSRYRK